MISQFSSKLGGGTKELTEQSVMAGLQALADRGFISFPVARVYVGNFMTELAQEYVKLRNANPENDKFETLKAAIENTRASTSNPLLNSTVSPEGSRITLVKEAESVFFGKRQIDKYLEKLA